MFGSFEKLESGVRSYCRVFPAVFKRAKGELLWDVQGRDYIDLFAGAGALNYGHNNDLLKEGLLEYIREDGITHGLDLHTQAKQLFLEEFNRVILIPRRLQYRMMFTGPTGTNVVEAALKLARKVTGRTTVAAFTNGFHGMSLGSLAATGSHSKRHGAGVPLCNVDRYPFDGYFGTDTDTISYVERLLADPSSGFDKPAAFLVETVQGEGGINVASSDWLQRLTRLALRLGSLLIVDDIQAGCGRTGSFFSFENAGLQPDLVCLSKSLSGFGLPLSMLLIRPELDVWKPGEHSGTFRGNNLAFVTARLALNYWQDPAFLLRLNQTSSILDSKLNGLVQRHEGVAPLRTRGRGLLHGLVMPSGAIASRVSALAFSKGVILESCGPTGEVLKFMPPLTISPELLQEALERVRECVEHALGESTIGDAVAV